MQAAFETKKLDDSQLEAFDQEHADGEIMGFVRANLDRDFPSGRFRFLDIGGGNGMFADRLLGAYPQSTGTVLDASELLIARNRPHERKTLIASSLETAQSKIQGPFDVICYNWLLHHLVASSYGRTLENMQTALTMGREWLAPGGRVSILENMYNGKWLDTFPSRVIFAVTSSKAFAPIARQFGANTAGVGVCFLSQRTWKRMVARSGLRVLHYAEDTAREMPWYRRTALHIEDVRSGHLWCAKAV